MVPSSPKLAISGPAAGQRWPDAVERYPAPPLAELVASPDVARGVYVISRVDSSGRVSDRSVLRAMEWVPGDRLTISGWRTEAVVLRRDAGGTFLISSKGHLQIPAGLRHRCAVQGGDRVLVAAYRRLGVVLVYTMAALERLVLVERGLVLSGGNYDCD